MNECDFTLATLKSMSPLMRTLWRALVEADLSMWYASAISRSASRGRFGGVCPLLYATGGSERIAKMLVRRRRKLARYAVTQANLACAIIKVFTQGRLTADHRIHNPEAAGSIPAPAPIPSIGVGGQRQAQNHAGQSLSCPALAFGGAL